MLILIIFFFYIKDTKLNVPVVTSLARDNQKLSKCLSKRFERSVYWNKYKTKSDNKIRQMIIGNWLFDLFYTNEDDNTKSLKLEDFICQKP